MDSARELRLVVAAVRGGLLDFDRVAAAEADWSPARRPSFLDHLAAGGHLTPAQVARLAAGLDTPAAESTADAGPPTASHAPAPADSTAPFAPESAAPAPAPNSDPGVGIGPGGRYVPLRKHAEGGLGQVWAGRDELLGRDVALKMLRPDRVGNRHLAAEFVREARVTGRLEHPSIVPVHDLIADAGPGVGPCYVMRFAAGRTLAQAADAYHAKRRAGAATRLDLADLLDALVAVCRAVAFAHARGVLHRDLKGQNVILGDFGEVFVLDWGLAKADPAAAGPTAADPAGGPTGVAGTPAYMAPEVAAGGPASVRSDVYGLGATLYAVLTGRPPAAGPSADAVLEQVRSADPPRPRSVNAAAPPALEAICRQAMARDPAARYATADDLATDLRRFLADDPVAAYPDPILVQAGRWARRHRTKVAAGLVALATAVVALTVGGGLLAAEQQRTAERKRQAEAERDRAEANLDAAHKLTVNLIDVTEKLLPPVSGAELVRRDLNQAAIDTFKAFAEQRPDSPAVKQWAAKLSWYQANMLGLVGDTAGAEAAFQTALDGFRADGNNPTGYAEVLRDHADLLARVGRLQQAAAECDESLAVVARLRAAAPADIRLKQVEARTVLAAAAVDHDLGRLGPAAAAADRAIVLFRELTTSKAAGASPYDDILLGVGLTRRASVAADRGDPAAAKAAADEAVLLFAKLVATRRGAVDYDNVLFCQALAVVEASRLNLLSSDAKDRAKGEDNLGKVLIRFADLANRKPATPQYRCELARSGRLRGEVRGRTGRPAEALADFAAARPVLEKLTADNPAIVEHQYQLGLTYLALSRSTADSAAAAGFRRQAVAALEVAAAASPDAVVIRADLAAARAAR